MIARTLNLDLVGPREASGGPLPVDPAGAPHRQTLISALTDAGRRIFNTATWARPSPTGGGNGNGNRAYSGLTVNHLPGTGKLGLAEAGTSGIIASNATVTDSSLSSAMATAATNSGAGRQTQREIAPSAPAASATWLGTISSTWSNALNWTLGGPPGSGDTATFNNAGLGNTTLNLGTGVTVMTILFNTSSAAAYTIGSGGVGSQNLTLNHLGAITVDSTVTNNETFNANIVLGTNANASTYTFTNNSTTGGQVLTIAGNVSSGTAGLVGTKTLTLTGAGDGIISGIISGNGSGGTGTVALTKSGTGTWTLSGTSANTNTGLTTINGGILNLSKTAGVNAIAGNVTIGDGIGVDILRLVNSNQIADTSVLTFSGTAANAGTFRMNAQSETVGGISSTGGAGIIENGTAGTSTLTVNDSASQTFSGIIQDGTAGTLALTKTGAGTLTLSGTNTYTGATNVNAGTLLINGTATGAVTVSNSGTTLGGTGTISGPVTINSGATILGGTGAVAAGALTLANNLTLNSGSIIGLALGAAGAHSTLARTAGTWSFQSNQIFTFIDLAATIGTYDNIITGLASDPVTINWTITNPGFVGTFTFDGANIDLTLTVIPEPGTWFAAALVFAALVYTQRRRLTRLLKRV
jgi:autotransporter-associated beta strand protein